MAVSTASRPPPPQLTWIEHAGSYRTPPAAHVQGWEASSDRGLIRIRLQLTDGSLLEIPLPRVSLAGIAATLQAVLDQGADPGPE
jgi:hypothetical protein